MSDIEYKGYTISPAPNNLQDGSGWDFEFYIWDHSGPGVKTRKFSFEKVFKTEEEAADACIARGKEIIDGK